MKQNINFYEFQNWFRDYRPDSFSRAGLSALFEDLEQYENDTGEEIEFDPIALCCEYTEYYDLDEFKANYTCEKYQEIEDWEGINDLTHTIPVGTKGFIIQNF
tara:strand:+ start:966 stop:1274 length:309 start_codon:yes stop_codon:yes gene_type:complete